MYPKDLIKFLQKSGWEKVSQKRISCKNEKRKENRITIIPLHNKDLKPKTLNEILKQAGLK